MVLVGGVPTDTAINRYGEEKAAKDTYYGKIVFNDNMLTGATGILYNKVDIAGAGTVAVTTAGDGNSDSIYGIAVTTGGNVNDETQAVRALAIPYEAKKVFIYLVWSPNSSASRGYIQFDQYDGTNRVRYRILQDKNNGDILYVNSAGAEVALNSSARILGNSYNCLSIDLVDKQFLNYNTSEGNYAINAAGQTAADSTANAGKLFIGARTDAAAAKTHKFYNVLVRWE